MNYLYPSVAVNNLSLAIFAVDKSSSWRLETPSLGPPMIYDRFVTAKAQQQSNSII